MVPAKDEIHVRFLFDPVCPWSWRTAEWIRKVRELRPLAVEWRLLSLEFINRNQPGHPMMARFRRGRWAMRLLALADKTAGNAGLESLYFALGEAYHERGEELADERMLAQALSLSGLPATLLEETRDSPELDRALWASYESASSTGAFGVPTLFFHRSDAPYYGPIIDRVPSSGEAGDLWDHIVGLTRHQYFYELKRPR